MFGRGMLQRLGEVSGDGNGVWVQCYTGPHLSKLDGNNFITLLQTLVFFLKWEHERNEMTDTMNLDVTTMSFSTLTTQHMVDTIMMPSSTTVMTEALPFQT